MRVINRYIYPLLTAVISVLLVLSAVFVFDFSYNRLWESCLDFWVSVKFYFCELFDIAHELEPTINNFSQAITWDIVFPQAFSEFTVRTETFFALLCSGNNFTDWFGSSSNGLATFAKIVALAIPTVLVLGFAIKKLYSVPNNRYNKDTIPLRLYKKLTALTVIPTARFLKCYIDYLHLHSWVYKLWITVAVFNLNLPSIAVSFLAYYFYFTITYRIDTLYIQVYKLIVDLSVVFKYIPLWIVCIVALIVFNKWRKKVAKKRLMHMERKNCGFINSLPIVSMTCGSMGKKKTTIITDMALSQATMFRTVALERLQKTAMKFEHFPWILFEQQLQRCMEYGTVYNLATVKDLIRKKEYRYSLSHDTNLQLYGYNVARYGDTYNDRLKVWNLFEVLETYAQLYFIYVIQTSLIVSNYSIRQDDVILDNGNFPLWDMDFFREQQSNSQYAHILDFDILRLGKKVLENNPNAGSFEFGVIAISEVGKERGNNLELKEVKKDTTSANQKNDLFNSWLKMCRHSATVDNYPFIKVFTDEQRPESWGADARELADIIHIVESGEQQVALPFYGIERSISDWLFDKFIDFYYNFRYLRGDNTLFTHLFKSLTALIYKYNARLCNSYGYSVSTIEKERGTQDGMREKHHYYLMNKKIYSDRFSTDCFSDYFNELARQSNVGLQDYLEYATSKASVDELREQHSYFIDSLYRKEE